MLKAGGEERKQCFRDSELRFETWAFGYEAALLVLYGCETWLLTWREERRLRVFVNRVLRRLFGSKRDEVTGEWKNLHNDELNDLLSSPNIFRLIK